MLPKATKTERREKRAGKVAVDLRSSVVIGSNTAWPHIRSHLVLAHVNAGCNASPQRNARGRAIISIYVRAK